VVALTSRKMTIKSAYPAATSIIILNWNGKKDTLNCLASVLKVDHPSFNVIVVDNGSEDDSISAINKQFPNIHLIETGKNLGYAGGNNVGIQYALDNNADYVLVLNNDTIVAADLLEQLTATAEQHPQTAAFGPVVCEMDKPDTIWTAGEFFTDIVSPVSFQQGEDISSISKQTTLDTQWVNGAAFFVKADIFREIGLFDEKFFLTYEESDWCCRAQNKGYNCLVVPTAVIWHKVASSFGNESSPLRAYYSTRNKLLFVGKNRPKTHLFKLLYRLLKQSLPVLLPAKHGPQAWIKRQHWALLASVQRWRSPLQVAFRRGIRDYLFRQFGECPPIVLSLQRSWLSIQRGKR